MYQIIPKFRIATLQHHAKLVVIASIFSSSFDTGCSYRHDVKKPKAMIAERNQWSTQVAQADLYPKSSPESTINLQGSYNESLNFMLNEKWPTWSVQFELLIPNKILSWHFSKKNKETKAEIPRFVYRLFSYKHDKQSEHH